MKPINETSKIVSMHPTEIQESGPPKDVKPLKQISEQSPFQQEEIQQSGPSERMKPLKKVLKPLKKKAGRGRITRSVKYVKPLNEISEQSPFQQEEIQQSGPSERMKPVKKGLKPMKKKAGKGRITRSVLAKCLKRGKLQLGKKEACKGRMKQSVPSKCMKPVKKGLKPMKKKAGKGRITRSVLAKCIKRQKLNLGKKKACKGRMKQSVPSKCEEKSEDEWDLERSEDELEAERARGEAEAEHARGEAEAGRARKRAEEERAKAERLYTLFNFWGIKNELAEIRRIENLEAEQRRLRLGARTSPVTTRSRSFAHLYD
ncbi:uncharacterized protein LOC129958887 [Argiope bruennichi]|uniref:uncharacterized protein LOC129958887 n=1 Tax=Argiope bruennichi TaxID=94029 RepID=UPI002494F32E|nr:uncharacterized protein LOC129958887 [Argiope bruennichi]